MQIKVRIVYSLRIHLLLKKWGFTPLEEMRNPQDPQLNCWVYEKTPAFTEALNAAIEGRAYHG